MVTTCPPCPVQDLAVAMLTNTLQKFLICHQSRHFIWWVAATLHACEETSLWSSAFLSIITALTISTKPMWATKTSTYLCIARFAELLDFASRNISVFITLPALVHSEPSADTALPGSCIGNTGISLQGGGLCFLRKGIWKWRRTIT